MFSGETRVLAAVFGPKAGTKKNENPEKACIEVIWKPKSGQIGENSFSSGLHVQGADMSMLWIFLQVC